MRYLKSEFRIIREDSKNTEEVTQGKELSKV